MFSTKVFRILRRPFIWSLVNNATYESIRQLICKSLAKLDETIEIILKI